MISDKSIIKSEEPSDAAENIIFDCVINTILKSGNEQCSPGWLLRSMNVSSTDEERDELYDRLEAADEAIRYLMSFLVKDSDIPLLHLIQKAAPEIDRLYAAIKNFVKSERTLITEIAKSKKGRTAIQNAVEKEFDRHADKFKYVKREHLDISYKLTGTKELRYFYEKILLNVIKDQGMLVKAAQKKIETLRRKEKSSHSKLKID